MRKFYAFVVLLLIVFTHQNPCAGQQGMRMTIPVSETTPSKSVYYDMINRNWHGSDEHRALADLAFFKWMHDTYGMNLNIFLFDPGIFDFNATDTKTDNHGSAGVYSQWYTKNFPNGLNNAYEMASSFNCQLGIWVGPDVYSKSLKDLQKRAEFLESLCRLYKIGLFKMGDGPSDARHDNKDFFMQALQKARSNNPNLMVLSHKANFVENGGSNGLTMKENDTYVDASSFNPMTGVHHRIGILSDPNAPGLKRLTEDHGTSLSSCLDYWDDDLILQAFGRNCILAPEIYGNPWLLPDAEFPKMVRIFNLHDKYNRILISGKELSADDYGDYAVSRGDDTTRLITLRNLGWVKKTYTLKIDNSIGINSEGTYIIKQYHPTEKYIARKSFGGAVTVEVAPFRSALFLVSANPGDVDIRGCDYQVVKNVANQPMEIKLLGMPGQKVKISFAGSERHFHEALLAGKSKATFFKKALSVKFSGKSLKDPYHRRISAIYAAPITPNEAEYIYEASCFTSDNNAMEIRSLQRAGVSKIKEVSLARNAFFLDSTFTNSGVWDRFAFDGDMNTSFKSTRNIASHGQEPVGAFRLDMGKPQFIDQVVFEGTPEDYVPENAQISSDLKTWKTVTSRREANKIVFNIPTGLVRVMRIKNSPVYVSEIKGYAHHRLLPRSSWRASNMFKMYEEVEAVSAWRYSVKLKKTYKNSYFAVSVTGNYASESVYAALKINGKVIGPSDRSPSFPYNNWAGYGNGKGNYTFYFPLTAQMLKKQIDLVVINSDKQAAIESPELWLTSYPIPYEEKMLVLK